MAAPGNWHRQDAPPVCPEPKVFVGQLPFETTTAEVQALFQQYGTVRNCQVISGPDGRSKGCAMILYSSWTEAEMAVEAENGTMHLGGSKPMVAKFADPPKRGEGPIVGIAPKKLFVGQIPTTMTEDMLRQMFTPYGNVTEIHLLKKNPGSGCGFVTFDRWSSCEAAIAGLHGKTQLEGAKMPIVVKFADAKVGWVDGGFPPGAKRGFDVAMTPPHPQMFGMVPQGNPNANAQKKAFTGMNAGFPYGMGAYGMGMGMANPMAAGMGMGYGMGMMGMGGMGMNAMGMMGGVRPNNMGAAMGMKAPGTGNQAMQASKMGSGVVDDAAKQWKLFVGQVPFEATESDLWGVFSSIGNILELVILRTPQGKSKGCAFVTFETREMAEKAIRQFDGQVCLPDDPKQRLLIVKYAGQGGQQGAPGAAAAALVGQNGQPQQQQPQQQGGAPGYGQGYETGSSAAAPGVIGPQAQQPQQLGGQQDMYAQQMAQMQQQGMYGPQQGQPGMMPQAMGAMQMPGAMGMGGMPGHMGPGNMQMGF